MFNVVRRQHGSNFGRHHGSNFRRQHGSKFSTEIWLKISMTVIVINPGISGFKVSANYHNHVNSPHVFWDQTNFTKNVEKFRRSMYYRTSFTFCSNFVGAERKPSIQENCAFLFVIECSTNFSCSYLHHKQGPHNS